jgi:hypothetical protein
MNDSSTAYCSPNQWKVMKLTAQTSRISRNLPRT